MAARCFDLRGHALMREDIGEIFASALRCVHDVCILYYYFELVHHVTKGRDSDEAS